MCSQDACFALLLTLRQQRGLLQRRLVRQPILLRQSGRLAQVLLKKLQNNAGRPLADGSHCNTAYLHVLLKKLYYNVHSHCNIVFWTFFARVVPRNVMSLRKSIPWYSRNLICNIPFSTQSLLPLSTLLLSRRPLSRPRLTTEEETERKGKKRKGDESGDSKPRGVAPHSNTLYPKSQTQRQTLNAAINPVRCPGTLDRSASE